MSNIRLFKNADLPALVSVWIGHWSAAGPPPPVSLAMIEQTLLAKTFFDASRLLIAEYEGEIVGWCHYFPENNSFSANDAPLSSTESSAVPAAAPDPDERAAVLGAICFSGDAGIKICDELLAAAEQAVQAAGFTTLRIGPLRDRNYGYSGLAPIGHGLGVPINDTRTSSLLSRSGYSTSKAVERLQLSTSQYRPPVNREALQLRRTTRIESEPFIPTTTTAASTMAHFDIEHHCLYEHRTGTLQAQIELWTSDPEAQVMDCAESILDLGPLHDRGELTLHDSFLITSVAQSLANRRIFTIETCIDSDKKTLLGQLHAMNFETQQKGHRWEKNFG